MEAAGNKSKISDKKKSWRMNGFEDWGGYMNAKRSKLEAQFEKQVPIAIADESLKSSNIFDGISIYVNGYTNPTAEELKRLMMIHGGKYDYYYSPSHTTYMIASNLPDSKIKGLKNQKVVTPNWITDSIKAGKLLPHTKYLLYTPEMVDGQRRLGIKKSLVISSEADSTVDELESSFSSISNNLLSATALHSTKDHTVRLTSVNQVPFNNFNVSSNIHHVTKNDSILSNSTAISSSSTIAENKAEIAIKAGHPDFVSEFYNHSRLHHISTSGQELKEYVQQLVANNKGKKFPGRDKLRALKQSELPTNTQDSVKTPCSPHEKTVMHVDMDCFFVSVGLLRYPELRGHPVAVTHSKGKRGGPQEGSDIDYEIRSYAEDFAESSTSNASSLKRNIHKIDTKKLAKSSAEFGSLSEIASCSYEARKAGLRNGMLLGEALRHCPNLKTIPYDFEAYSDVSKKLYDTVASYTLDIEAVSCDELFIDCTELLRSTKLSSAEFATILRNEIFEKTGCTASAGVGGNMLLARLATRVAKPNGKFILLEDDVIEFMKKQNVKDLPGVGHATASKLKQLGVQTCADLQSWSISKLQQDFGPKTGLTLYEHCRGKDDKPVTIEKSRKSVSAEINYGIRFNEEQDVCNFINELAGEVHRRLKKIDKRGKCLTLKVMVRKEDAPVQTAKFMGHGVCYGFSKSVVLKSFTDDPNIIGSECYNLARALKIAPTDYRGLGIQVTKLESSLSDVKGKNIMEQFLSKSKADTKSPAPNLSKAQNGVQFDCSNIISDSSTVKNHEKDATIKKFLMKETAPINAIPHCYDNIIPEQLDQCVLNALPEDLRSEILSACTRKQNNVQKSNISPLKKAEQSILVSKAKHSIPQNVQNSKSIPQKTLANIMQVDSSNTNYMSFSNENVVKGANLSGACEIEEVRLMVKEWIISTGAPSDEDIDHFRVYLMKLIDEDLEKTDLVLKYFYRLASSAHELWKETYLLILSYVQQKMLQNFGHMLKAKDSF